MEFIDELKADLEQLENVRKWIYFSGVFTLEEINEYDRYIKELERVISYIS